MGRKQPDLMVAPDFQESPEKNARFWEWFRNLFFWVRNGHARPAGTKRQLESGTPWQ